MWECRRPSAVCINQVKYYLLYSVRTPMVPFISLEIGMFVHRRGLNAASDIRVYYGNEFNCWAPFSYSGSPRGMFPCVLPP